MEIVREKPCQRLHHRVTAPLKVTMDNGECLVATNWSLGGLRLDALSGSLPKIGALLNLTLELPFQGFDISFDVKAEVVRTVEAEGTVGAQFLELSERAHDLMSHFIEDLIRGKMATIEDTICRIDVPVTPISTTPDANPSEEMPARRWSFKTIAMSAVYIALGIGVFTYLAVLIYSYTTSMEVTSAVVSAPLVHVTMPVDGQIVPVALEKNIEVRRGQKLARVIDPKIDSKISDLHFRVEKERRDLFRAQERLRIEKARMELYRVVNRTELQVAKAHVDAARESLSAADIRFERVNMLREKGLIEQSKLDVADHERVGAETRLRQAELELERMTVMESVSSRRHFNKEEFVADLDLLALEVEEANSKLALTNMQLEQLESKQVGFVITAPFDGRIVAVSASGKTSVERGKSIATIEKISEPEITAFLDQEQIVHVGMDDVATVYLPAIDKSFEARVREIDRSASSLTKDASHYVWSGKGRKSASVSLSLVVPETERHLVRGGLPAVVIFSRRSKNRIYIDLKDALRFAEL